MTPSTIAIVIYTLLAGLCWLLAGALPPKAVSLAPFLQAAGWTFLILVAAVAWFGRMTGSG